MGKTMNQDRIC